MLVYQRVHFQNFRLCHWCSQSWTPALWPYFFANSSAMPKAWQHTTSAAYSGGHTSTHCGSAAKRRKPFKCAAAQASKSGMASRKSGGKHGTVDAPQITHIFHAVQVHRVPWICGQKVARLVVLHVESSRKGNLSFLVGPWGIDIAIGGKPCIGWLCRTCEARDKKHRNWDSVLDWHGWSKTSRSYSIHKFQGKQNILIGGLEHFLFFHVFRIVIPTD